MVKKMEFIFGDIAMTLTPDDIEAVLQEWETKHPGKVADRDLPSEEFSQLCMERMKTNARPTRTVLHN